MVPKNNAAVAATQVTAPTAGTTAGRWTFNTAANPCIVSNGTGAVCYVNLNTTTDPTATSHVLQVADGAWEDVSLDGQINVMAIEILIAAGGAGNEANLQIHGWELE